MHWYYQIGRRVWPYEIWNFFFRDRYQTDGPTLAQFWGAAQDREGEVMGVGAAVRRQGSYAPKRVSPAMG